MLNIKNLRASTITGNSTLTGIQRLFLTSFVSSGVSMTLFIKLDSSVGVAAAFLFDDASCFAPVEFAVVVAGVGAKGVGGVAGEEGELSSCWSVLGFGF